MKHFVVLFLAIVTFTQAKDHNFTFTNNVRSTSARITGGKEAKPNSFPYQAAIFVKAGHIDKLCGGTILADQFILTAAHCVYRTPKAIIVLGAHDLAEDEPTQRSTIATEFIVHDEWNTTTLANDIALIKLSSKIPFSGAIQRVKLPCYSDDNKDLTNSIATVCGWGLESDNATEESSVLRFIEAQILNNDVCKVYSKPIDKHLCLSGSEAKSSCVGDSGGPAVVDGVQHGITSFVSVLGCELEKPHVYTRVASFLSWIHKHTGIEICP